MPVDPQVRKFLDLLASLNLPELSSMSPATGRQWASQQRAAVPPGPDAAVQDHHVSVRGASLLVRAYRPRTAPSTPLPTLVWFHGGGFVIGSVAESDADCRHLAVLSGCAVLSVDYRLAPEHPYPAAPEDCFAAVSWIVDNAAEFGVDPARVAVGGDSAGGNLATIVALMARERGGPELAYQLLLYPVTDLGSFDTPSYLANADGYYLTRRTMQWFADQYVPDPAQRAAAHVSPLRAPDLRGLPPAFVATAEHDPLCDEGEAYAARLREAGVEVELRRYDGMIHGFFSMNAYLEGGQRVLADSAAALARALGA